MITTFKKLRSRGASNLTARGSLFGRFARNSDGVAAVEFALLAPLMLTLMLGALEITQSIWADGKVEQATSTIGDLVSRAPQMDNNEMLALGAAGPLIMDPNPQNDLKFTVTSIIGCFEDTTDPDSKLEYYVLWSKVWQNNQLSNSTYQNGALFTKQPEDLDILDGDTLIVTEGFYTYSPTISRKVGQSWEMGGYAFHQPRDKDKRIRYPGVEDASQPTCNDFRNA